MKYLLPILLMSCDMNHEDTPEYKTNTRRRLTEVFAQCKANCLQLGAEVWIVTPHGCSCSGPTK